MIDEDFYNPAVLGFVMNVIPFNEASVKKQLISVVQSLESDDRCYMCHQDYDDIPPLPGLAVKHIAGWKPTYDFRFGEAIRKAVCVLGTEDDECEKYLFIVLDKYKPEWEHEVRKALNVDLKFGYNVQFYFCAIGDKCDLSLEKVVDFHPQVTLNKFDGPDQIGKFILHQYKPIPNHVSLDIDILKVEFKERYGRKKNKKS